MLGTLVPIGVRLKEHYCRRWLPVSLFQILEVKRKRDDLKNILFRAQRAKFMDNGDEVLFISIAHSLRLRTKLIAAYHSD